MLASFRFSRTSQYSAYLAACMVWYVKTRPLFSVLNYATFTRRTHRPLCAVHLCTHTVSRAVAVFLVPFDTVWVRRLPSIRKQTTTTSIVLCLTILALFASTTTYMVTCMLSCQYVFLKAFISSGYALWSYNVDLKFPDGPSRLVKDYSRLHSCGSTAAITINVRLPLQCALHVLSR